MTISGYYDNQDKLRQEVESRDAAQLRNAEMRGEPYTTQPRTPEETAGFLKHNPPAEPTLQDIHRRLNSENIDLRGQLEMAHKARDAAQELLEAERQKNAALTGSRRAVHNDAMRLLNEKQTLKSDLDTEKLLRTSDAATIADLERRLREAEGQLREQRKAASWLPPLPLGAYAELRAENATLEKMVLAKNDEIANLDKQLKAQRLSAENVAEIRAYVPYGDRVARAENVELRRTISLMAKTAAEVQDNFRLIAELAADPADEARTRTTP